LPFFHPPRVEQRRGRRASAAVLAGGLGHGGGRDQGKRERRPRGVDSSPQFQRRGARREGRDGHGRGGQAAAVGGVAGAARCEHR